MTPITFSNDGPKLVSTNYWQTELARRGYVYLTTNAGCFRLLLPEAHADQAAEMAAVEHIVVSMLPLHQWRDGKFAVGWLAEDNTDEPWSCHMSPGQIDRAPKKEDQTATWEARVYVSDGGAPEEALVKPAHLRFVPRLPFLEPLAETLRRASKGDA